MKIIGTFAVVEDSLYSVQYESEDLHEFAKCFELWNNPVYLREFFEKNIKDLNHSFWKGITIEDAIKKTREDAAALEEELLYIAETGKTEKFETLTTLFEPLSTGKIGKYERDKVRGFVRPSWLRIYAIRIDANFYVISGGAIKLTRTMNTREHLLLELNKLETTRNMLMNENSDDLIYFELN
jgi:hypothetical protein